jgi:hypothetical protein
MFYPQFMNLFLVGVLGVVAVFEFFLLLFFPSVAIESFAVALLVAIATGFAVRGQGWFLLDLPAGARSGVQVMPGVVTATYPQTCLFRIELRNLPLLFTAIFYCMFLLVVALADKQNFVFSYDAPIVIGFALATYAAVACLVWLKERRLVRLRKVTLGLVHPPPPGALTPQFGYQFFDLNGDRRGGMVVLRRPLMARPQLLTPVFFDPKFPDYNKAGFSFLFHQFVVVDARHLPQKTAPAE